MFLGEALIIPLEMRLVILSILHESHLGIEKTRAQARNILYWPGMSQDIEHAVKSCSTCAEFSRRQQKEPMIPHEIPLRCWQKLGVDIFDYGGNSYLCVVDYFSKFPIIRLLKDKTATTVNIHLKSIFAEQGIPEELVSDNMPFNSKESHKFSQDYGFKITTSSPTYAQSNGLVKRMIGTIKQLLRKSADPYIAMLEFRNTPITGLKCSPAQVLISRRLRSKIPVLSNMLQPCVVKDVREQLIHLKDEQSKYYNISAKGKPYSNLNVGDKVRIRDVQSKTWQPTIVKEPVVNAPRSYVVDTGQGLVRRNRKHIMNANSEGAFKFPNDIDHVDIDNDFEDVTNDHFFSETDDTPVKLVTTRSGRVSKPPMKLNL